MSIWGLPSEHAQFLKFALLVMRVPGFLLLDVWWYSLPDASETEQLGFNVASLLFLSLAVSLLLLPLSDLVHVYMHIISGGCIIAAHLVIHQFLQRDASPPTTSSSIAYVYIFLSLLFLTCLSNWCLPVLKRPQSVLFPGMYLIPVLFSLGGLSLTSTKWSVQIVDSCMVILCTIYSLGLLKKIYKYVKEVFDFYSVVRREIGNHHFISMMISRAWQPESLVLLFSYLFLWQVWSNYNDLTDKKYIIKEKGLHIETVVAIAEICETPLAVISLCATITYISKSVMRILSGLFRVCGGGAVGGNSPWAQTGVSEGMVAFVLSIQTGLVDLEMPSRVGAIFIILFIVAGTLIQSSFEVTKPVLLALPATNRKLRNHVPVLSVILIIIALPAYMLAETFSEVSSNMWMLVVISNYVVTIVQSTGALCTYALFMWDSIQKEPSQHMDDYVYYIKGITKSFELVMSLSIVAGGYYECIMNDEFTMMNIWILNIHCYFNIYQRITAGWKTHVARRETKKRLATLENATAEELEEHGDVCSICYMEMNTAKKTRCAHYFHENCLRRWVYVQDNCPMCTASIIVTKQEEGEGGGNPPTDASELEEETEEETLNFSDREVATSDEAANEAAADEVAKEAAAFEAVREKLSAAVKVENFVAHNQSAAVKEAAFSAVAKNPSTAVSSETWTKEADREESTFVIQEILDDLVTDSCGKEHPNMESNGKLDHMAELKATECSDDREHLLEGLRLRRTVSNRNE